MPRPELFQAYQDLNKDLPQEKKDEGGPKLDLHHFVETYITSLSNMVRAFPKNNLDIAALEAHLWDRLKTFYRYERFGEVAIETKEDGAFINGAIKLIEDWFYKGEWTSCLETPTEEKIQEMLAGNKNSFLERARGVKNRKRHPNLGRDGSSPLPNIYQDARSGRSLSDVYREHAFKFFHSPAAVMNTLTKVKTERQISADQSRFRNLIAQTSAHSAESLRSWGYKVPKLGGSAYTGGLEPDVSAVLESEQRMHIQPPYIRRKQEYKRNLFFFKTSMVAAEMIRRTDEGELTKEGFQKNYELA